MLSLLNGGGYINVISLLELLYMTGTPRKSIFLQVLRKMEITIIIISIINYLKAATSVFSSSKVGTYYCMVNVCVSNENKKIKHDLIGIGLEGSYKPLR